jgi:carboxylesterase
MPASTWQSWLQAVDQAYSQLATTHRRVQLVGFSTGAVVVLKLALERRLTEKLVLLAPFLRVYRPSFSPLRPELLVNALRFVKRVPRRSPPLRDAGLRRVVEQCAGYRSFSLEATRSALELIAEVSRRLGEVRAPVLIIQGQKTPSSTRAAQTS